MSFQQQHQQQQQQLTNLPPKQPGEYDVLLPHEHGGGLAFYYYHTFDETRFTGYRKLPNGNGNEGNGNSAANYTSTNMTTSLAEICQLFHAPNDVFVMMNGMRLQGTTMEERRQWFAEWEQSSCRDDKAWRHVRMRKSQPSLHEQRLLLEQQVEFHQEQTQRARQVEQANQEQMQNAARVIWQQEQKDKHNQYGYAEQYYQSSPKKKAYLLDQQEHQEKQQQHKLQVAQQTIDMAQATIRLQKKRAAFHATEAKAAGQKLEEIKVEEIDYHAEQICKKLKTVHIQDDDDTTETVGDDDDDDCSIYFDAQQQE